jgi:hypothetical protein
MENLGYWKLRYVEARDAYDEMSSKANREEKLMCKRVVGIIEAELLTKVESK